MKYTVTVFGQPGGEFVGSSIEEAATSAWSAINETQPHTIQVSVAESPAVFGTLTLEHAHELVPAALALIQEPGRTATLHILGVVLGQDLG